MGATVTLGGECDSEVTVQRPGGLCIAELGLLRLTLHASRGSSRVPHPHLVLGALDMHLVKNRCEGSPRLKSGEDHHANRPGTGLAAPPQGGGEMHGRRGTWGPVVHASDAVRPIGLSCLFKSFD